MLNEMVETLKKQSVQEVHVSYESENKQKVYSVTCVLQRTVNGLMSKSGLGA